MHQMHLTVLWDQRECLLSFSLSRSILSSLLGDSEKHLVDSKAREPVACSICFGILQFSYSVDKKLVAERESADELAVSISNLIRQQGFQIDSFSLQVSVPPIIQENDRIACSAGLQVQHKQIPHPFDVHSPSIIKSS
ncbi:unnamed protein product [Malus baccata var. baccata]